MVNITTLPLQTAYDTIKSKNSGNGSVFPIFLDKHRQDIYIYTHTLLVLVSSPHLNQVKQLFAIIGAKNINMLWMLKKNHYYN